MFSLAKHYFDGIDASGNTIILYAAELSFFAIKIPYTSYILFETGEKVLEKGCLKKPVCKFTEVISIHSKELLTTGRWQRKSKPLKEILYEKNKRCLIWNCHLPKGNFEVAINKKRFEGLGYCETIYLPFAPWKLPIETLKWGRFLSEQTTIIWIEWIGPKPLKKIYWNGEQCYEVDISNDKIIFHQKNTELIFNEKTVIRNNPLAIIASRNWFLKIIFPKKFLRTHEIKYRAKGYLITNQKITDTGWALFESVKWSK